MLNSINKYVTDLETENNKLLKKITDIFNEEEIKKLDCYEALKLVYTDIDKNNSNSNSNNNNNNDSNSNSKVIIDPIHAPASARKKITKKTKPIIISKSSDINNKSDVISYEINNGNNSNNSNNGNNG